MSTKTSRRSFVDLAEAVRTLNVDFGTKESVARDAIARLDGYPDFSAERFEAHALSEVDGEEGKWAFNKAQGTGPGSGAYEVDEDDADDEDDSDESGQN